MKSVNMHGYYQILCNIFFLKSRQLKSKLWIKRCYYENIQHNFIKYDENVFKPNQFQLKVSLSPFPPAVSRIGGAQWRKVTKVFYPPATPLFHSKKIIPSLLKSGNWLIIYELFDINNKDILDLWGNILPGKSEDNLWREVIRVGRLYPLIPLIWRGGGWSFFIYH